MDASHLDTFKRELETLRAELLEQIAQQRGGTHSRADVAAEHFAHSEDAPAQVATERDVEFALNERETAELNALDLAWLVLRAAPMGNAPTAKPPSHPRA